MIVQCCVCKQVRNEKGWVPPDRQASVKDISHGYCPECAQRAFEAIRRYHALKNAAKSVAAL